MKTEVQSTEEYVNIILDDEREKIVSETPTEYSDDKIERIYEFEDGAVVKYEWQNSLSGRTSTAERYNHRFTLIKTPLPNSSRFKEGIIEVINYPF
ncbi:MAG: hypothetical protein H0U50_01840 [Pyrinomonadaceae bacterium]|nr:hypothetical protein [Pyrinomonadaceae bacterium]